MSEAEGGDDPIAGRLNEDFTRLWQAAPRVWADWMGRQLRGDYFTLPDPRVVAEAYTTLGTHSLSHPWRVAAAQVRLWGEYAELTQRNALRLAGQPQPPAKGLDPRDRRFRGEGWEENPYFAYLREAYLITARELLASAHDVSTDLDAHERARVEFYTRQFADALAPSNFAATNPEVLAETLRTGGANLLRGLRHLTEDLARGGGLLRIRQTDANAFELGRDIAATPGKVIYQNALMQLIQYSPATDTVARRPLLIVPPWINKYYILDLTPKKSFIRWAVEQGLTVFVISWVNPDQRYAETGFDDYLLEGPLAALDAIEAATGEREVNAIGYCIGGTLLACTLAWMAARGDQRVKSATYFTSLLEFSDVGPMSVFIDEEQIRYLERDMNARGYLEGTHLANAFNLLQANDLIWGFVVNNYLLGRDPAPFDLLYWNSDSTRMPRRMHSFYLRNMYLENRLREPGGIELAGEPIDLSAIRLPAFFVATRGDHIAPWHSCYRSALLHGGRKRFVLGGSGHIAGVINPAGSQKYGYWSHGRLPADPEQWLAAAQEHQGSWWPEWLAWVQRHSGGEVPARSPGDGALTPIEEAPGSYVRVRVDET
ncbi:PHA/PHB synthase family protein [Arhodomonas sp. SL1]|uniref:PHA/PHB synthase family protein n=1 Tax=Arhodomonas sp. SL1 TaxID=3425691 RepID=UPI003F88381B